MKNFSTNSFIIGLMFGMILAGAWFLNDTGVLLSTPFDENFSESKKSSVVPKSGAISVTDQIAGSEVFVESVTVPPPGVWVAVREVYGDSLGNILGAFHVNGPQSSITIPLLRATEADSSYAVQLYRDDGTATFDPSALSVYVDFDTGARVVSYFNTLK
mgnify:CR=1 FL=1